MVNYRHFMNTVLPQALSSLFAQHHGLVSTKMIQGTDLPAHWLSYYTKLGLLERTQYGVYRLVGSAGTDQDHLLEVMLRIPKAVICCLSALAFYQLGTVVPSEIHLAIANKARRPKLEYPPLALYYFSPQQFEYGIQTYAVGGGQIRIYSKEKTLADVLHLSHRIERSIFLEALKSYLNHSDRDLKKLFAAAKVCLVEQKMRSYTETVLA